MDYGQQTVVRCLKQTESMKKVFTLLLLVCLCPSLSWALQHATIFSHQDELPHAVPAAGVDSIVVHNVEVDGICYGFIGSRRAYVTHHGEWTDGGVQGPTYSGDLVIPEQISYNGRTYTVFSVDENAFAGSENLTSVSFPSTVLALSSCAFFGCSSLRQVTLPKGLLSISNCAFVGCASLQQVTLPRHAERVDSFSFYCCSSLTSVVLPHRIHTVCHGALEHLPAMTHLYSFASAPPVAEPRAFTLADQKHCILHVPAESLSLYQASPVWSDFSQIVALSDEDYLGQDYQRGDVNDDGQIDAEDLALLRRLIVRLPDDASVRWAADINADGIVNAVDFVTLAQRLQ